MLKFNPENVQKQDGNVCYAIWNLVQKSYANDNEMHEHTKATTKAYCVLVTSPASGHPADVNRVFPAARQ